MYVQQEGARPWAYNFILLSPTLTSPGPFTVSSLNARAFEIRALSFLFKAATATATRQFTKRRRH